MIMATLHHSGPGTGLAREETLSQPPAIRLSALAGRAHRTGTKSRMVAFACVGLSTLACAASLAWILMTPSDQGLTPQAFHARLLWGGLGALFSLASGVAGMVFWPQRRRLAGRPPDSTLSMYDSMTGLPTERLFLVLLTQAVARVQHGQRMVAVLVIALEHCRPGGQGSGLQNLTLVVRVQAARIKGAVQSHDTVARLGEHRFAVILDSLDGAARALTIAQDILRTMSLPLVIEGHELLLSCRIGVSVAPVDGTDSAALLAGATQALADGQRHDAPINFLSNVTALTSLGAPEARFEPTRTDHRFPAVASRR